MDEKKELKLLVDTLANPDVANLVSVVLDRTPGLKDKGPAWWVGNELKIRVKLMKRVKVLISKLLL